MIGGSIRMHEPIEFVLSIYVLLLALHYRAVTEQTTTFGACFMSLVIALFKRSLLS